MGSGRQESGSRTRSVAFVGLSVALMGVSAWVAVPLGPVMLTLQMFALVFGITLLQPKEAVAAVCAYVALGAVGLPVFSGGRGGLGVVLGPTGGYIVGYAVGAAIAAVLLHLGRHALGSSTGATTCVSGKTAPPVAFYMLDVAAGVVFTAVSYLGGWAWFMAVMQVGPAASFAATVAPFAVLDLLKVLAACACSRAVKSALRMP